MKKKITSVLLLALSIVALAGCNKKEITEEELIAQIEGYDFSDSLLTEVTYIVPITTKSDSVEETVNIFGSLTHKTDGVTHHLGISVQQDAPIVENISENTSIEYYFDDSDEIYTKLPQNLIWQKGKEKENLNALKSFSPFKGLKEIISDVKVEKENGYVLSGTIKISDFLTESMIEKILLLLDKDPELYDINWIIERVKTVSPNLYHSNISVVATYDKNGTLNNIHLSFDCKDAFIEDTVTSVDIDETGEFIISSTPVHINIKSDIDISLDLVKGTMAIPDSVKYEAETNMVSDDMTWDWLDENNGTGK